MSLIKDTMGVQFDPYVVPGPEVVDLGLPSGLLWAKCNLGAQTETDYGNYYQWAATTPLHVEGTTVNPAANWSLCPYCTDPSKGSTFSKYNGTDGLTTLQASDDAITSQFTGYRMPTKEDFEELVAETNNEWVSNFNGSGVGGYKFTSESDSSKYIFLSFSGECHDSNLNGVGQTGYYWSSSLDIGNLHNAWCLCFYIGVADFMYNSYRYLGYNIRPVQDAA